MSKTDCSLSLFQGQSNSLCALNLCNCTIYFPFISSDMKAQEHWNPWRSQEKRPRGTWGGGRYKEERRNKSIWTGCSDWEWIRMWSSRTGDPGPGSLIWSHTVCGVRLPHRVLIWSPSGYPLWDQRRSETTRSYQPSSSYIPLFTRH